MPKKTTIQDLINKYEQWFDTNNEILSRVESKVDRELYQARKNLFSHFLIDLKKLL